MGSRKRTRPQIYRLEGHTVIPIPGDLREAVTEFGASLEQDRHVAVDDGPGWHLSTVFLGLDHNHHGLAMNLPLKESPPLVFETAIFRKTEGVTIADRYSTWEDALSGHNRILSQLKSDSGS